MTTEDSWSPVLVDPEADAGLRAQGHVIVPFLTAEECQEVREAYEALRPAEDDGLALDVLRDDRTVMHAVRDLVRPLWPAKLAALLTGHQTVVTSFVVKYPGPESSMLLHREPTYVLPDRGAYNVWVPLVDVGAAAANGAIELALGTEHLPYGLVGTETPMTFRAYETFLRRHLTTLDVPAGWAAVYDSRMLHASAPNRSTEARPAVATVVAPAEAALVHVVATGRRGRAVYDIDDDYFVDFHPMDTRGRIDERYRVRQVVDDPATLSPKDVAIAVGSLRPPEAETVVPPWIVEVLGVGALPSRATTEGPPGQLPTEDLGAAAAAADGPPPPPDVLTVTGGSPGVAVLPLAAATAVDGDARRAIKAIRRWAVQPRSDVLVVLDRGTHLAVRPARDLVLDVYEAPVMTAGMAEPGGATTLEVGRRAGLPGEVDHLLWNEGPGPVWAVIRPQPRP